MQNDQNISKNEKKTVTGRDRGSLLRSAAVIALLIVSFVGSTLLHSGQNTKLLRESVETLTKELSSLLSEEYTLKMAFVPEGSAEVKEAADNEGSADIEGSAEVKEAAEVEGTSEKEETKEATDNERTADIEGTPEEEYAAEFKEAIKNWQIPTDLLPEDCAEWVIDKNGNILQRSEEGREIPGEVLEKLSPEKLKNEGDSQVIWAGDTNPLLLTQDCYVASPLEGGSLFLVTGNEALSIKATQRSQFALYASVNTIIVIITLVLIYNMIARLRRQLLLMATTDELTKLANRKFFRRQYEDYIREAGSTGSSLFLLDIDYFKDINDSLGHSAGDLALKGLAAKIQVMVIENGGFAGRWGGDEFIGVLPLRAKKARTVLEKLCRDVVQAEAERGFPMSISVGVTTLTSGADLSKNTEKADEALYCSKENGRNQVTVYAADTENAADFSEEAADGTITIDSLVMTESDFDSLINMQILQEDPEPETAAQARGAQGEAAQDRIVQGEAAQDRVLRSTSAPGSTAYDRSSAQGTTEQNNRMSGQETAANDRRSAQDSRLPVEQLSSMRNVQLRTLRKKLAASIVLGVKWMTPFIAGGGILIALAFLFDAAAVDISRLPLDERANFGTITSLAATLKQLGGITFNFMLPVFAGFMAFGLAGENAFMAGFVGGFMTIESNTGFAGAMIAGLTAGLITSQLNLFTRRLPKLIRKIAPIVIFPILNLLILQALTTYTISPAAAAIGRTFTGILDGAMEFSPIAGGGIVSMMMSIDMGGVINKIAYQYGLDAIAANRTGIMAAVMIGGMVPPIGIALSMLMFRRKYTRRERESAAVTMVMGLSFITEGALPYVFTDVLRVIPSCMAGSFVAGILSAMYGCTLPAPHGGVFVIPVIEHPILYILALLCGSLVTAVLLGCLKKERE